MATSNVELEFAFEDESTKKVTIGPFDPSAMANVKTRLKDFNANTERQWEANSFANENGSFMKDGTEYPNTPIAKVTIVTTEETEVV